MTCHYVDEMQPSFVSPGVKETVLLSMNETHSKILSAKVLTIERGIQTEPKQYLGDIMCYTINGKAALTINQLNCDWKYPFNHDTAAWIPPMSRYVIKNMGDTPFRCIEFSSKMSKDENISDILEQHLCKVIERHNSVKEYLQYNFKHTLFLRLFGARKLYFGGYLTIYPRGLLPRHVPSLDCEEVMYVTRGAGKMTSGDSEYEVALGSLVYVPPHTWHSIENSTDDYMEVLVYEAHS